MTPTIKTPRLTLSFPLIHDNCDLKHYVKWLENEEVVRYSEQRHYRHTQETQFEYMKSFVKNEDAQFWEISVASNPIGSITAFRDRNNNTANVGIMIGERRVWGNGYGPEAWEAVCDYLSDGGTRKIEAGCMASNTAMQRILDKTGFLLEAVIQGHFLRNGKPEDKWCYGKNRTAEIIPLKKSPPSFERS